MTKWYSWIKYFCVKNLQSMNKKQSGIWTRKAQTKTYIWLYKYFFEYYKVKNVKIGLHEPNTPRQIAQNSYARHINLHNCNGWTIEYAYAYIHTCESLGGVNTHFRSHYSSASARTRPLWDIQHRSNYVGQRCKCVVAFGTPAYHSLMHTHTHTHIDMDMLTLACIAAAIKGYFSRYKPSLWTGKRIWCP